jgi:Tol biopolymer transport system component
MKRLHGWTALVGGLGIAFPAAAAGPLPQQVTERISVATDDQQGNGHSLRAALSADGRFVAFASYASNLVPGDTNGTPDVFVRDRHQRTTERVSVSSSGTEGDAESGLPALSADGRFVAFRSLAENLVAEDTNETWDVFVRDRAEGSTVRVSVSSNGTEGLQASGDPALSADGRFVAFESLNDLVADDTNGTHDVYVHDRETGVTERVSVSALGEPDSFSFTPSLSADGRYVAFHSFATNLVPLDGNVLADVFVRDRFLGTIERVSVDSAGVAGDSDSMIPSISADGRFVAFDSLAGNLVAGDSNFAWDVFVHDRVNGTTERVSLDSAGNPGNFDSQDPALSADARFVVFHSTANNLVSGDMNDDLDVFVRDRTSGITARASVDSAGAEGIRSSFHAAISGGQREPLRARGHERRPRRLHPPRGRAPAPSLARGTAPRVGLSARVSSRAKRARTCLARVPFPGSRATRWARAPRATPSVRSRSRSIGCGARRPSAASRTSRSAASASRAS